MAKLPIVAIVGRPNVGKSSLLNALAGRRISIVQDMPGVTRDRVAIPLKVSGRYIELVDTGGYGFVDPDALTDHIRHQIELAMTRADLVLFIVDAQDGLTSADEQIAALLRRQGINTVLVANKADSPKADPALGDFARLGLGTPVGVSAQTGRNINLVLDLLRRNLDLSEAPAELPEPALLLAIVGKRNAGKSTLVNAIAELYENDPQRVIVSEVPGTTRDSIDVRFEKDNKTLTVIDTAGVRKKRHMVTDDIAFYSFHRAQRSIRRADVVLMLIDGVEHVSEPDQKLAQYIAEQYKPVILVVNKWDLVLENARRQAEEKGTGFSGELLQEEFREYLDQELRHLTYAPIAFITAKDGRKVQAVIDLAQHLHRQANQRLSTGQLNRAIRQVLEERRPSTPRGQRVRIYYATQVEVAPPTIVLFVNNPQYISEQYKRFVINRLRDLLPYPEVPIRLLARGREGGAREEEAIDPETERPQRRPKAPAKKKTRPRPANRQRGDGAPPAKAGRSRPRQQQKRNRPSQR